MPGSTVDCGVAVGEATTTTAVGVAVADGTGVRVGARVLVGFRAAAVCVSDPAILVLSKMIWVACALRDSCWRGATTSAYSARQTMLRMSNPPTAAAANTKVRLDDSSGGALPTSKSSAIVASP